MTFWNTWIVQKPLIRPVTSMTNTRDFIDYMSNSEKSDGLFNAQSDLLTESDKEKYRQLETVSRDAGCPKYYGVVSFDNNFP
ncbi:relaxase MobL [Ruminococcus sp.]|uniref:relaxase MobL n=1 Tax=Ruminococcus sp. TaxID=41978 RepID=UPI0039A07A97